MKRQNRIAFLNILSVVLLQGLSLITAPLFSRLLGTSGYGVLNIYNIWVSAIAFVFPLQTTGTLVNARVEYPEEAQKKYQSAVMTLSAMSYGLLSALVVVFLGPVSGLLGLSEGLVLLMLLQGFGTFCVNFLSTKFVYEFKAGRNMALSLTTALGSTALSLILVLSMEQERAYLGRITANALIYGLFGIAICLAILAKGRVFVDRRFWKFCVVLAIPTIFYNLSDLILGQIDRIMLQRMLDDSTVGQYSMALNLSGIMNTLFMSLNNTWCPTFFEDKKKGEGMLIRERAVHFLEVFTVLCLGFVLLAPEVYHIFASRDYWPSTPCIPIMVTSCYLNFLCTFPVNYEYYHKKTKVVAAVTITSSLCNAVLNYILIQSVGMLGAAAATCASHLLQLTLHYLYCRYRLGRRDYPFGIGMWGKYALCFLPVAGLICFVDTPWLLRWGAGAAIGVWELLRLKKRKVLI